MSGRVDAWRFLSQGWDEDGHPHNRTEHGFCESCGAGPNEYHYRLVRKATDPGPPRIFQSDPEGEDFMPKIFP